MAEPAVKPMTLEEFLRWDDGTETHYELIGGFAVAMAPPAEAHRILAMRLGSRIDSALAGRRPCNAQIEAGVARPDRVDTYFEADIAVTCESNEPGRQTIKDPLLIVEILSPGNEAETRENVWAYATIPSVSEILLVRSTEIGAELLRRQADGSWPAEPQLLTAADEVTLVSLDFSGPLAAFYRDTYLAG